MNVDGKAVASIGTTIDGKYRIESILGEGGMGTVYLSTRLMIGDTVAVKILHSQQVSNPQAIERFRREAQAAARLKHQNAVIIYDFGVSNEGLVYLVMELAEGQSLRDIIKQQGPVTPSAAAEIMSQVCAALDAAHRQNIVHRDLKPDNIIVAVTNTGLRAKVLDFGIAKMRDLTASNLTQTGAVMGTPYYMSPEHCMGEELDHRSDIYSLGIVLFEMLAGVVPFNSPISTAVVVQHVNQAPPSLRALNASISAPVEAVVMRALAKRRDLRQQTAVELAQELIAAVQGRPVTLDGGSMQVLPSYSTPASTTPAAIPVTGAGLAPTIQMTTPPAIGGARTATPAKKRLPLKLAAAVVIVMAAIVIAVLMWSQGKNPASTSAAATITSLKVGESINFPIVELSDQAKADRINIYLKDRYAPAGSDSKNTFQENLRASNDELSYKVVLNTQHILTIEIASSSGRAGDRIQHHFDLSTGYIIPIDQIIMPSKWDEIRKLVCNDSKKRLVQVKNKVKTDMENGRGGWNNANWYEKGMTGKSFEDNWRKEMKKEYWEIELEKGFDLSNNGISFHYVTGVGLPMSVREEEPASEYYYSWAVLKPFLIPSSPISTLIAAQSVEAPKPVIAAPPAPAGMVYVPGNEFTMGNDAGDESQRPQHKVAVNAFFIDVKEVTCEEYEKFIRATRRQPPATWVDGHYPNGWERRPVTGIDWDDATAYAEWAGKRLPTEQEWEFAARGSDGRLYPWGSEWKDGSANAGPTSPGHLESVGTYSAGVSPFGALDMVGNAWEWTASDFVAYPGGRLPGKSTGMLKVIRGGCFLSRPDQATATIRVGWPARGGNEYDNTSFRCAKNFPATP